MNESRIYRLSILLIGLIMVGFSIQSFYILSLDKEDFKAYSGKPIYSRVDFKKKPSRSRYSFLRRDSIAYVEMHIKLENYESEFVIGNFLNDQFFIIKKLIQEANILTIRARKEPFWDSEFKVYQIDSNRRNDIVSLSETTDHLNGVQYLLLILGIGAIIVSKYAKVNRYSFDDD